VPALAGVAQPDLILLNDGDLGYALVRFDPRSLATVTRSISELADPLTRAVCWNAITDMVQQAELPVPTFAATLAGALARETSVSVLQFLLMLSEHIVVQFADPRWVPEGKRLLAGAAAEMLRGAEPGSDHQLAAAGLLDWTATSPAQLDLIAGLLDGGTVIPGLAVDTDLRWSLLQRLAATGRADDARVDAELARDATDAGRRHAAACLAAMPDAGHKEAAWRLMTGGELGTEGLVSVARGFAQPEQVDLLAPYAERYLPTMTRLWSAGNGHQRVLLGELLFPYPAASEGLLAQIDEFLAGEVHPSLARVLTERRDTIRRALRSRQLPT
jgi:aminopeptidase N